MAELEKIITTIDVRATLVLNEKELRALDALRGYGIDEFLAVFYRHLGESYLKPHEAGLRSLFEGTAQAADICNEARECRQFMAESAKRKLRGEKSNG